MTLLCRPKGRGNWTVIVLTISAPPDLFKTHAGSVVSIAGFPPLRIVEVRV